MTERTWWEVFRYPVLLGAAIAVGLTVALVDEHVALRAVTWAALTAPIAVVAHAIRESRR